MKVAAYLTNLVWEIFSKKKWKEFEFASLNIYSAQEKYLRKLLNRNKNTIYGKRYGFKSILSMEEYRLRVPVTEYEDYHYYIEQIRIGKKNIISNDPITRFALTSGAKNSSKWIPYNKTLKREFDQSFGVWIYNLFENFPSLKFGTAFWAINPNLDKTEYISNIPVGMVEYSKSFGVHEKFFTNWIQSVPSIVSTVLDFDQFKYITLLFLLADSELRLISIRNPTYLKVLLDFSLEKMDDILKDMEEGTISFQMNSNLKSEIISKLKKNPKRAAYLRNLFKQKEFSWEKVWQNLTLISLWTEGNAKLLLNEIESYFPNVKIQGKGLLSTEAFISFPLSKENFSGNVLGVTSHFYEFKEIDSGKINLFNELKLDSIYEVIVTTGGGLYRYVTKDRVQVKGFYNQIPSLIFLGKEEIISDLVGEKLSEIHLYQILNTSFKELGIVPEFYYVQPSIIENKAYYTLFLESLSSYENVNFAKRIDHLLEENILYAHFRRTNQLLCFEVKALPNDSMKEYFESKSKEGPTAKARHSLFHNKIEIKKDST